MKNPERMKGNNFRTLTYVWKNARIIEHCLELTEACAKVSTSTWVYETIFFEKGLGHDNMRRTSVPL
jgi:hypothetical protein